MSTFYKTAENFRSSKSVEPSYIPQPFLNYGGLTKMLDNNVNNNNRYSPNETNFNFHETRLQNDNNLNLNPYQTEYRSQFNTLSQPQIQQQQQQREYYAQQQQQQYNAQSFRRPQSAMLNTKTNTNINTLNQQKKFEEEEKNRWRMEQAYVANKTNPNLVEGAPTSFWMTHINTGDVYRSFVKGTNPWARSSAFTQPIQNTRGALRYYQNARDSPMGGFLNAAAVEERLKKEREEAERIKRLKEEENRMRGRKIGIGGIRENISKKILDGCKKKGWIGLRGLKNFLEEVTQHKCDIMDKNSFKYHLARYGIILDLDDIEGICEVYDTKKDDHLNFVSFLNNLRTITENRGDQIEDFLSQVRQEGENFVFFSKLQKLADMKYHPEALRYTKSIPELRKEYQNCWGPFKIEDVISEENFRDFFYDVSTVVVNDKDFTQILKTLGYK